MLRTIFSIGLFAVLGLIALKFIFGIFGLAVGLFVSLLFLAVKIGLGLARGLFHHPDRESEHGEESQGALVRQAVSRRADLTDSKLPAPTLKNGENAAASRLEPGALCLEPESASPPPTRAKTSEHRLVGRPL